ncbi:hypothetical protein D3272_18960 [Lichenibacterium ramalinae]|uniref:Uncharacterized protein n=1 Tax=Lichenibacterium ramalinae TaxID=2316527 RepID=A0A4Q2R7Z1_9HYPH|nr:hypothetical protein D3272_18960 [Lichenibacterium ramalinae]
MARRRDGAAAPAPHRHRPRLHLRGGGRRPHARPGRGGTRAEGPRRCRGRRPCRGATRGEAPGPYRVLSRPSGQRSTLSGCRRSSSSP